MWINLWKPRLIGICRVNSVGGNASTLIVVGIPKKLAKSPDCPTHHVDVSKIMVPPNHPFVHRVSIIFTIHFGIPYFWKHPCVDSGSRIKFGFRVTCMSLCCGRCFLPLPVWPRLDGPSGEIPYWSWQTQRNGMWMSNQLTCLKR